MLAPGESEARPQRYVADADVGVAVLFADGEGGCLHLRSIKAIKARRPGERLRVDIRDGDGLARCNLAVDAGDDVSRLNARLVCRAAVGDLQNANGGAEAPHCIPAGVRRGGAPNAQGRHGVTVVQGDGNRLHLITRFHAQVDLLAGAHPCDPGMNARHGRYLGPIYGENHVSPLQARRFGRALFQDGGNEDAVGIDIVL